MSGNRRFNTTGNLAIRGENLERKLWKTVNGITGGRDNWWVTEFWNVVVREECEEIDLKGSLTVVPDQR